MTGVSRMPRRSILIVEDDEISAEYMKLALEADGYEVRIAGSGVEGLLSLENRVPDAVVSDLQMPGMSGLDLLMMVKQRWCDLPFLLVTVEHDLSTVVDAVRQGAFNFLVKPVGPESLVNAVTKAVNSRPCAPPPPGLVEEFVGRSPGIVKARHLIVMAARSDVNVLITGETGTGKELAARAVHRHSSRSSGPFLPHNCAVMPNDLFESEFFGHVRGSFTGAHRDHPGIVERADGGTLFLDELETLSPSHQAKLLRVIDDGEVRRVGSDETRRVSTRFLAATNRDPQVMMDEGTLRADLYFRLRGLEIRLPPLRDRSEDIPLLVAHFLGDGVRVDPEVLGRLEQRAWPGNVRELKNAVRTAQALAGGRVLTAAHFDLGADGLRPPIADADLPADNVDLSLKDAEARAVLKALRTCDGNKSLAARQLGIDRSTLRRKLRQLRLDE